MPYEEIIASVRNIVSLGLLHQRRDDEWEGAPVETPKVSNELLPAIFRTFVSGLPNGRIEAKRWKENRHRIIALIDK